MRTPPASSTPWLVTVARHKLIDHWRRQARANRVLESVLSFGLPMVCLPLGREQPANAAHVAAAGAGRTVAPGASVEEVRATVAEVLADDAYRAAARSLASAIAPYGNGARAVDELERLLG